MELPNRLRGIWNAADFAEEVLRLGEEYTIFHELVGKDIPMELIVRCFGALSLRPHVLSLQSTDAENEEHAVQIRSVSEPRNLSLVRRFEPETEAPFVMSSLVPPHMYSPHGDVSFNFERVTSLNESQR